MHLAIARDYMQILEGRMLFDTSTHGCDHVNKSAPSSLHGCDHANKSAPSSQHGCDHVVDSAKYASRARIFGLAYPPRYTKRQGVIQTFPL